MNMFLWQPVHAGVPGITQGSLGYGLIPRQAKQKNIPFLINVHDIYADISHISTDLQSEIRRNQFGFFGDAFVHLSHMTLNLNFLRSLS